MAYSVSTQNSGFNQTLGASGGKTTSAFGAINFGANSSLGGATTSASDSSGGSLMLYVLLAAAAVFFLLKR
jgi:hypothetical protein